MVIETPDGHQVVLAHLMDSSVTVREGDSIQAGERIAACGDTGSATEPHLHIHAQSNNQPLPMRFGTEERFIVKGDRFGGAK